MPTEIRPEMTITWPFLQNKRICIDLDGVVCEYDFPKIVKNFFGVDLSSEDIYAYKLPDVLGVSPESIDEMFEDQVWGKPNFIPGAIEALHDWEGKGYELVIYSNRVKYMGELGLINWLGDWQIPFKRLHTKTESHTTTGYYVTPNYDVHIDDSPKKLMSTNSRVKLLFHQPWNKRCRNITGELVRVKSWEDVRKYV